MVEINDMNNSNDYNNGDSGNNNRGIVVGVNRFPSFFAETLANPSFSLTKVLSKFFLRYSFATIRFLKWKINNEGEKLNSFQANAPLMAHEKGVHFWGSIFPSKMEPFAPFLATIQALSRTRAFL
jgi:hypothetical protein